MQEMSLGYRDQVKCPTRLSTDAEGGAAERSRQLAEGDFAMNPEAERLHVAARR